MFAGYKKMFGGPQVARWPDVAQAWFNLCYPMPSLGKLLDERDEGDGDGLWDEGSIKENTSGLYRLARQQNSEDNQAQLTDGFHFVLQSLKNSNFDLNSLKTIGKTLIWGPTSKLNLFILLKVLPFGIFSWKTEIIYQIWFWCLFKLNENTIFRNI